MSRSPHEQSDYKLSKLPYCKRCKIQLIKVMVAYDNDPNTRYEWECPKCHKYIPVNKLSEPQWNKDDIELSNWYKNE